MNIEKTINDVFDGLDKLFTSDEERMRHSEQLFQLKLELYKLQSEIQQALIQRNEKIAKKSWLGRWPEILAIVGCAALFVDLVARPILAHYGIHFIDIDESVIIKMLFKLLGLK